MFSKTFELVLVVAAFILGTLEGQNFWAWVRSFFVKEEVKVITATKEVVKLTSATGPTGA